MTPVAGSARPVVPICIVFALHDAVCFWRDHGLDIDCFQHAQHPFWCVIRFIGQERLHIGDNIGPQRVRAFEIVRLSRRQVEAGWVATGIAGGVD